MKANDFSLSHAELNLHTPLLDILNCDIPVIGAGMGGVARAELAVAVSAMGGLGTLGMVREEPEFIVSQVEKYRSQCKKEFSVNIIPAATDKSLLAKQVDCLIELEVPVVTLFWDVDFDLVERLKSESITVIHQVGSEDDALKARAAGVDILIAQGYEAGGHIRGKTALQNLLPVLCRNSAIPIVAAGGIASGAQLLAAFSLGAQGVCLGTALLATDESNAHQLHKTQVVQARAEDAVYSESFIINWSEKAPVRVIKNPVTDGIVVEHEGVRKARCREIGQQDGKPIYLFSTDSPLRGATGALDLMSMYAGQSCEQIDSIESVARRIDSILDEARIIYQQLGFTGRVAANSVEDLSSSPCFANEISGSYGGFADYEEIRETLNTLLAAERAGARVCALSMALAPDDVWLEFLRSVHRDEADSCQLILQCMHLLGVEPHDEVGDFEQKCLAIPEFYERMKLLNKGQEWVVKKLEDLLPRLESDSLRRRLTLMRQEHIWNVARLNTQLSTSAPSTRQ